MQLFIWVFHILGNLRAQDMWSTMAVHVFDHDVFHASEGYWASFLLISSQIRRMKK